MEIFERHFFGVSHFKIVPSICENGDPRGIFPQMNPLAHLRSAERYHREELDRIQALLREHDQDLETAEERKRERRVHSILRGFRTWILWFLLATAPLVRDAVHAWSAWKK